MLKLNLGCGTNKLEGWDNRDADVDITKPLPWKDSTADFVFAEHVVEHVYYEQALGFFRECHRVLKPGGVVRIAVPSVEQVMQLATGEYCEFTKKWVQHEHPKRRAMTNILFMHGHKAPWTKGLLVTSLYYVGFDEPVPQWPGGSSYKELLGVEGHGKVIGEKFNGIETVVVEAKK